MSISEQEKREQREKVTEGFFHRLKNRLSMVTDDELHALCVDQLDQFLKDADEDRFYASEEYRDEVWEETKELIEWAIKLAKGDNV